MLSYTEKEIKQICEDIFKEAVKVIPIGHHTIGRNLVYKILKASGRCIIKFYFKENKIDNEVKMIKLLEENNIKCPKFIQRGLVDKSVEYLVISFLEGELLLDVEDKIPKDELENIYSKMGTVLSEIHNIKTYNCFNTWELNDENRDYSSNLKEAMLYQYNRFYKSILQTEHKEYALIQKSKNLFMDNLKAFEGKQTSKLVHHDFSKRNVLVKKINGKYQYFAVIDFEHSKPSDPDLELVDTYIPILNENKILANAFMLGYESNTDFDRNRFNKKIGIYKLFIGMIICSWSQEKAPDYYKYGLNMLENTLGEFNEI